MAYTYDELCKSILDAQEEMLKAQVVPNTVILNGKAYGKLIENCPPGMKPTIFGMALEMSDSMPDDYHFVMQYKPPKQTNADRIRAMSDEELAEWITGIDHDNPCPPDNSCSCSTSNCRDGWLAWLKKEVEA